MLKLMGKQGGSGGGFPGPPGGGAPPEGMPTGGFPQPSAPAGGWGPYDGAGMKLPVEDLIC